MVKVTYNGADIEIDEREFPTIQSIKDSPRISSYLGFPANVEFRIGGVLTQSTDRVVSGTEIDIQTRANAKA